jgi:signal transduction histidine kinase/CheY-like chemotaxis protein
MLRKKMRLEHGALQRRLFFTILAGLVPLVLLSYLTLIQNAESHKRQLIEAMQNSTRSLNSAIDAELEVSLSALDTLASSSRLKTGDLAGFHGEARELLARRPNWANVVLSTPQAEQLVNARLPYGARLPRGVSPEAVEQVAWSGKPLVGNITDSPVLGGPAFAVHVRASRPDGTVYVLSAPIWPTSISNLIAGQRVPDKSLVTILDSRGMIVARSMDHRRSVGKKPSASFVALLGEASPEGWAITTTLEGRQVYAVYTRSRSSGWISALGVPVEEVDGPIYHAYGLLAASILLAAVMGFGAAWLIGRSITAPLEQLATSASAAGRGEAPRLPATSLPEIRQLGDAIAVAHSERERLLFSEREAHRHEREARHLAEEASLAKDEFLAMLGHELRNPLAPISTAAQLLKLPDTNGIRARQLSAIVERHAHHLTRLVDDILDVSRVTRKLIMLRRELLDLNDVLPQAFEQVQQELDKRRHSLSVCPAQEAAWVMADRTRIVQVLVNLLQNAARFTPDGGSITLKVEVLGQRVRATVADNGVGISPTMLPRVFQLFSQGDRDLDRPRGGLGLGLPLVNGLVALHDGRVDVASAGEGLGSSFMVELPLVPAPCAVIADEHLAVPAGRGKLRLMVVDDNTDAGDLLALYLGEHCGYDVTVFSDPLKALGAAVEHCPDVLLLDIGMPRMDGFELARRLKANPATHGAVLFAVSGYGQQKDRDASFAAGFVRHFAKPVNLELLVASLEDSVSA